MTPEQREHMVSIATRFNAEFAEKYKAGAIEHDGLLSQVGIEQMIKFAKEEVIDQVSYVWTLEDLIYKLLEENKSLKEQLNGKL